MLSSSSSRRSGCWPEADASGTRVAKGVQDLETAAAIYLPPWRIDVTRRVGVQPPVPIRALARTAARALDAAGAPSPASLAVILADDAELLALNTRHMGEHHATDVLSFPMLQPSAFPPHPGRAGNPPASVASGPEFQAPPGRRAHLGDIVISVERAIAQAEGWTPADEVRQLLVHGVLHVCGWDHADPVERDSMRALERAVLGVR